MAKGNSLRKARTVKNDEFYTQYQDIEEEVSCYQKDFYNASVYCNCDNPEKSNFWKYFYTNFHKLGLKKLTATYFDKGNPVYQTEYDGNVQTRKKLIGNGDFRSPECVSLLSEADIVVTNEPFSLVQEFIALLLQYHKKLLILGNINAISGMNTFYAVKNNQVWRRFHNGAKPFEVPDFADGKCVYVEDGKKYQTFGNIVWFTNLESSKQPPIHLSKKYYGYETDYPKYLNFDAIDVGRVSDIPMDYYGVMGVPLSWLSKACDEQFEIIGMDNPYFIEQLGIRPIGEKWMKDYRKQGGTGNYTANMHSLVLYDKNNVAKAVYSRILIRRKQ